MTDKPKHATCELFIDKLAVDLAYNPAQVVGAQVIAALNAFYKDRPEYDRLTINVEVSHSKPQPIAAPAKRDCNHLALVIAGRKTYCNDCGDFWPFA